MYLLVASDVRRQERSFCSYEMSPNCGTYWHVRQWRCIKTVQLTRWTMLHYIRRYRTADALTHSYSISLTLTSSISPSFIWLSHLFSHRLTDCHSLLPTFTHQPFCGSLLGVGLFCFRADILSILYYNILRDTCFLPTYFTLTRRIGIGLFCVYLFSATALSAFFTNPYSALTQPWVAMKW